ncbi:MAG: WYL domain-containing protein [candidate division Zixibacteria bacterium]|nr:WYL domain-containing protein [candidate division Zixibacteria bacterium]NIR67578.1 WYL domain-containing protein [candidate division Zixibacteria bacterium]NIS16145.1 WYL domain-containing protein [candidate division Zixibacteria bacterium]NIS48839.1 WYL domain-containing protein [candidate division Zixibacteria bacterium]NIT52548.1 WYL domain-containing protein [candidate division Zixibacteria bacterium]
MQFCFIDTETTGLYTSYGDRICEIGILAVDENLEIIDSLDSLVNPLREISPAAYKVNRIENAELLSAPLFTDLAEQILKMIDNRIMVGHNILFDNGFLKNEFRLAEIEYPGPRMLDTRDIARGLVGSHSYGLSSMIRKFGIEVEGRHRAMDDCLATYQLFKHLLPIGLRKNYSSLEEMVSRYIIEPEKLFADLPDWLQEALEKGREIEIEYTNRGNITSRRKILPLSAFDSHGKLYIEAFCQIRQSKRTFLVERIKNVYYEHE